MKILDWFNHSIKRTHSSASDRTQQPVSPWQAAMEDLWFSLSDDPNQQEKLTMLLNACREKGGSQAVHAALEELIQLPQSWLPQLCLARIFLEENQIDQARDLYRTVIERKEVRPFVLAGVSADLGEFGYAKEIPDLVAPYYDADLHSVYIGLNLLQAYRDTTNPNAGLSLLENIRKHDSPEIHEYLEDFAKAFAVMNLKRSAEQGKARSKAVRNGQGMAEGAGASTTSQDLILKIPRPLWIDVPIWRNEYPNVSDLLPRTEGKKRVGLYMYADISAHPSEQPDRPLSAIPTDLSVGLPIYLGERLLFTTQYAPIVLLPVSREKGPYASWLEPDIQSLFGLCTKESLDFVVTGTITKDGEMYRTRSWILDKAKQSARIVAKDLPGDHFGESFHAMIEEIMILFFDKRHVPPSGADETFTYRAPFPELMIAHLQGMRAVLYQQLVRLRACETAILPDEKKVFDMLVYLSNADTKNQMYFMALFFAMQNSKRARSGVYLNYREDLYRIADNLRSTPVIKVLVPELNEVLKNPNDT
jgi:tetratricopeptide (TPR) repeat protein